MSQIQITNLSALPPEERGENREREPRVWKDSIRGWRFACSWVDEGIGTNVEFPTHGRRDTLDGAIRDCAAAEARRRAIR